MKHAYLYVTPELLVELLKVSKMRDGKPRRFVVEENPLPDDTEVVGVDSSGHCLRLLLESETFADVGVGETPDLPPPIYRSVF